MRVAARDQIERRNEVTESTSDAAPTESPEDTLARLRASIDNIDAALVYLLAERFRATQQVGLLKARHEMPASDPRREEQQVARLRALAESAHLDPEFAEKWFNFVVAEVIRHHVEAGAEANPRP
ncbi:chorismate mutase [Microbacterium marinilacus]|uniref:Chorismate mutase n=1 Tax=Microbacterium marinilacus TaxID=415209 RepID=A0ABP7BTD3_9MICO|nr:chorismate mutase [Microbacterium marinilacus]